MITEQTEQTPEELAYAEISAKVTAANLAVEAANEAFNLFRYNNRISTPEVIAGAAILRSEVEKAERELQKLLPAFAEAKSRVMGWR